MFPFLIAISTRCVQSGEQGAVERAGNHAAWQLTVKIAVLQSFLRVRKRLLTV